jgi:hypothetical protein
MLNPNPAKNNQVSQLNTTPYNNSMSCKDGVCSINDDFAQRLRTNRQAVTSNTIAIATQGNQFFPTLKQ